MSDQYFFEILKLVLYMIYDSRVTVHVERIGCEAKNYAPATSDRDSRVTILEKRLLN